MISNVSPDFNDPAFVERLWHDFYPRMKLAVRNRVRSIRRPVANESEIALSAFNSFIVNVREGKFPDIEDQDHTWRLLKLFALRKTSDTFKRLRALKRGGQEVILGQADFSNESGVYKGINAAADQGGSPAAPVEVADLLNTMLQQLPDDRHRDVILLKLQGASVVTIAECMETTTRTVQRLLKKIEESWKSELLEDN